MATWFGNDDSARFAGLKLEDALVHALVPLDHRIDRESLFDASPALAAIDFVSSLNGFDGFGDIADQEAGDAVGNHLSARAEVHGDDWHAGGVGLGQDEPKPLRDRVEVQHGGRLGEKLVLA